MGRRCSAVALTALANMLQLWQCAAAVLQRLVQARVPYPLLAHLQDISEYALHAVCGGCRPSTWRSRRTTSACARPGTTHTSR